MWNCLLTILAVIHVVIILLYLFIECIICRGIIAKNTYVSGLAFPPYFLGGSTSWFDFPRLDYNTWFVGFSARSFENLDIM